MRGFTRRTKKPKRASKLSTMNASFFELNRSRLRESLKHGSLIVITGYGEMQHRHDCVVPFAQEANFYYLTGITEPDWWWMQDGISGKEYLVRPDMSEQKQIFDGSLSNFDATRASGIKNIIGRDEAMRVMRTWAKTHSIVYTTEQPRFLTEMNMQLNHAQSELHKVLERTFKTVQVCTRELAQLRAIKQPEEIVAIEKAITITIKAFEAAKIALKTAKYEYEIEAAMTHEIRRGGASGHAYTPIVAAGGNACTLHYVQNNQSLRKKELLLIDVGACVDGYAADITRTYAIGTPSKRQKTVHAAVCEVQSRCINLLKPGLSFQEYEERVRTIMEGAIDKLGLPVADYRKYFPHAIGHGLGLDVHDALHAEKQPVFQPGMVVTVEPGIYIPGERIGVRIEDDVLITENGHKNLSAKLSTDW